MDKFIPLNSKSAYSVSGLPKNRFKEFVEGETALIDKVFSNGIYSALLRNGNRVKVKGPIGLDIGTPVRVFQSTDVALNISSRDAIVNILELENEAVLALTAVLPLAFGGKGAKVKMEIYTPKQRAEISKKKLIYLILTLTTEGFGDLQWSVHLWGRNAQVQLYGGFQNKEDEVKKLIHDVENSFLKAGFILTGSVCRIREPFLVPQGFRLEWKV
jgi:hypothetical protein